MNEFLLYAVFALCGLLAVCFIGNIVLAAKGRESSAWLGRGVYVCGILAVICNGLRMLVQGSGTMAFANVVVLLCVVVAFVRAERERKYGPAPDEDEGDGE